VRSSPRTARAYAKALFSLATERNETEIIARELETVTSLVEGESALADFFDRPWIAAAAKKTAAAEVATRLGVSTLTRDFLTLVAARGRADHLGAIARAYRELMDAAQGVLRARVRTAAPLGDEARTTLAGRLGQALPGKRVVIEEVVDAALLGGFVAEIGSLIVDGSLDGQLARMRARLATG
jgi:F-type H+-transporting ATPase subunit delta